VLEQYATEACALSVWGCFIDDGCYQTFLCKAEATAACGVASIGKSCSPITIVATELQLISFTRHALHISAYYKRHLVDISILKGNVRRQGCLDWAIKQIDGSRAPVLYVAVWMQPSCCYVGLLQSSYDWTSALYC
jgi:hypothetical protein